MDIDHNDSDMQAALRAGAGLAKPQLFQMPSGGEGVLVPEGFKVEMFPPLDKKLSQIITAAPRMDDAGSFIAYVNRFKTSNSVIFANLAGNQLAAILDYHHGGEAGDVVPVRRPDHCVHRAAHPCPWSLDWARWRGVDGKPFKQAELAAFLEEMAHTIFAPESATLLEIASDLRIDREVKFKTGTRLADGTVALAYEEVDQTNGRGGKITIPDTISIGCPIFQGGDHRMFSAKLRYRLDRGELSFVIKILNRDAGEQEAFQGVVESVRAATVLPVFYGTP